MSTRRKRILWLLNHRTLMPAEVPLLQRLGYEVFVPKIIPADGFRSGHVDHSYDVSLSIPPRVLDILNSFDFYSNSWTTEVATLVNRYFGTAITMMHGQLLPEVVEHFAGQVVLRAFGVQTGQTFTDELQDRHGVLLLRKLQKMRERFWFGEGYDNLHEVEGKVLRDRAVHLPIGIPQSALADAGTWTGTDRTILFVCPDAASDDYYGELYRQFKSDFGDLPHVIVGSQRVPLDDPHVLGFISNEELARLYRDCAVMYYASREERHVHYSPIEAAIAGLPVIFYTGTLLDRLGSSSTLGRVSSSREARVLIERLLAGDADLVARLQASQRFLSDPFTDPLCIDTWRRNLRESGFDRAIRGQSIRSLIGGASARDLHQEARSPEPAIYSLADARSGGGGSLEDGIRFSDASFPSFVHYIEGVGRNEEWGRWSSGDEIVIVLAHTLHGDFRLFLRGLAFGENASRSITITIGSEAAEVLLTRDLDPASTVWRHFHLDAPTNVIRIAVPVPTAIDGGARSIGVGLSNLGIAPMVVEEIYDADKHASTLLEGIDFGVERYPGFVDVEGLGSNEKWGRWSVGRRVRFELDHLLAGTFMLALRATALGENADREIPITIGTETALTKFPPQLKDEEVFVGFSLSAAANTIEVEIPEPQVITGDDRRLGVGFSSMRFVGVPDGRTARAAGVSLDDGIDFSATGGQSALQVAYGLDVPEAWGRWSTGPAVHLLLRHTLEGRFQLLLRAIAHGPNIGRDITITIGSQTRLIGLSDDLEADELAVEFDLPRAANEIHIVVPEPTMPPGGSRMIGVGLISLRLASASAS